MTSRSHEALLVVGSNIGPEVHVPAAVDALARRYETLAVSSCYRSPSFGGSDAAPPFVNLAAHVRTDCPPRALREGCRRIEEALGRRRTADRFAPRTVDVDVVLFDRLVADLGGFALPDPLLVERAFMLRPAAEAWPDGIEPRSGRSLAALAAALGPGEVAALERLEGEPWSRVVERAAPA